MQCAGTFHFKGQRVRHRGVGGAGTEGFLSVLAVEDGGRKAGHGISDEGWALGLCSGTGRGGLRPGAGARPRRVSEGLPQAPCWAEQASPGSWPACLGAGEGRAAAAGGVSSRPAAGPDPRQPRRRGGGRPAARSESHGISHRRRRRQIVCGALPAGGRLSRGAGGGNGGGAQRQHAGVAAGSGHAGGLIAGNGVGGRRHGGACGGRQAGLARGAARGGRRNRLAVLWAQRVAWRRTSHRGCCRGGCRQGRQGGRWWVQGASRMCFGQVGCGSGGGEVPAGLAQAGRAGTELHGAELQRLARRLA